MTEGIVIGARGAFDEKREDEQRTADRAAQTERFCFWILCEARACVHAFSIDTSLMDVLRLFAPTWEPRQRATKPPSTVSVWPVMYGLVIKNSMACAMSSG